MDARTNAVTAPALWLLVVAAAALIALVVAALIALAGAAHFGPGDTATGAFIEHAAFCARRI